LGGFDQATEVSSGVKKLSSFEITPKAAPPSFFSSYIP